MTGPGGRPDADELARRAREEAALVGTLVDRAYYTLTSGDLLEPGEDPVENFCRVGWRHLRKPSPDFDVWWYWANHLDPAADDVNPLLHYAVSGRAAGLSTRPEPSAIATAARRGAGARLPTDRPVRRACLFAGFDRDGIVDEAVVSMLRELARHADVFYLSDGYLPPDELAKIDDIVTGAWAVRHASYDFGSYSMLARDLVGWQRLEAYDEVLFVNDSCFLVRPLDELFATMDARACDWWGLQATKGLASTRGNPRNGFAEPIPLDRVRDEYLGEYEDDPVYDFHLGSYFLAVRRPVLDDPVVRRLLDSVHQQPSKLLVILKYEIGLTHLLLGRGHTFETYVPDLHPFHPLFTETHFRLIDEGFPLLKRYLIYQNHYDVPDMAHWKERVLAGAPEAPVDMFERTLVRSAPNDRLERSYSITRAADGKVRVPTLLRGRAYERRDAKTEKQPDVWAFPVDIDRHRLPDNSRAVFEAVRDDPAITKVILTRSRRVDLPGSNVVSEPLLSPAGRAALLRAGVVFVDSRMRRTLQAPVYGDRQAIIAVRRGLILERQGRTASSPRRPEPTSRSMGRLDPVHAEPITSATALLVASDVDRLAAMATYWPATFSQTWDTGLPAHDFLLGEEEALPVEYAKELAVLRTELKGRRLVLLATTYRRTGSDREPYVFSEQERDWLRSWAHRSGVVIGVREEAHDLERPYSAQLGDFAIDVSAHRFPDLPVVLRAASAVITDFSGTALDFAVTGGPVVSFVPDLPAVRDRILYDLEHLFPGPVTRTFEDLTAALTSLFDSGADARQERARGLLFGGLSAGATDRTLARLGSLTGVAR